MALCPVMKRVGIRRPGAGNSVKEPEVVMLEMFLLRMILSKEKRTVQLSREYVLGEFDVQAHSIVIGKVDNDLSTACNTGKLPHEKFTEHR